MSKSEDIYGFVAGKVSALQSRTDSGKTSALAKLRRAVGKQAGSVPEIWEYVYEGIPVSLQNNGTNPSHAEVAIQAALTLYALHSQGNEGMHTGSAGTLGNAAGILKRKNPANEAGIKRRFDALATAKTSDELIYHSRGIIQLLKQGSVKLDYGRLAKDLYNIQFGGDTEKSVQRQWGRDFYSNSSNPDDIVAEV